MPAPPSPTRSRAQLPPGLETRRIITEKQYAELEGVSVDTIRRRVAAGKGARRRQLSARRHGYEVGDILAARQTRQD
jgi:hypothetical protein